MTDRARAFRERTVQQLQAFNRSQTLALECDRLWMGMTPAERDWVLSGGVGTEDPTVPGGRLPG